MCDTAGCAVEPAAPGEGAAHNCASPTGSVPASHGFWFKELTDKRLRRGTFNSVEDLTTAITTWTDHWNKNPKPFIWKATAENIIVKVRRGRTTLNQINSQADH